MRPTVRITKKKHLKAEFHLIIEFNLSTELGPTRHANSNCICEMFRDGQWTVLRGLNQLWFAIVGCAQSMQRTRLTMPKSNQQLRLICRRHQSARVPPLLAKKQSQKWGLLTVQWPFTYTVAISNSRAFYYLENLGNGGTVLGGSLPLSLYKNRWEMLTQAAKKHSWALFVFKKRLSLIKRRVM